MSADVPAISGVDTRRLTLLLRTSGAQNGAIVARDEKSEQLSESARSAALATLGSFPSMVGRNLIGEAGVAAATIVNPDGAPSIALLDCGVKANILRLLVGHGCRVVVLPSDSGHEALDRENVDALFISSGPGDPAVLDRQTEFVKSAVGKMPVLGICLGHQLIARAIGAVTYKMKFGHHGVNHPVREEGTGRVFVTSQNHGFGVDEKTLPQGCRVWFRNANDGSIEGVRSDDLRLMTTQFHPESAPGPDDALWIFDEFLKVVG
jgi:carbamoyl-phosphate synthase small subunit